MRGSSTLCPQPPPLSWQAARSTEQGHSLLSTPHPSGGEVASVRTWRAWSSLPLCLWEGNECLWLLQIDLVMVSIKYSFRIITCSLLIYRLFLKGHNNILKIFQIILATATERAELGSFLLLKILFSILGTEAHFCFFR